MKSMLSICLLFVLAALFAWTGMVQATTISSVDYGTELSRLGSWDTLKVLNPKTWFVTNEPMNGVIIVSHTSSAKRVNFLARLFDRTDCNNWKELAREEREFFPNGQDWEHIPISLMFGNQAPNKNLAVLLELFDDGVKVDGELDELMCFYGGGMLTLQKALFVPATGSDLRTRIDNPYGWRLAHTKNLSASDFLSTLVPLLYVRGMDKLSIGVQLRDAKNGKKLWFQSDQIPHFRTQLLEYVIVDHFLPAGDGSFKKPPAGRYIRSIWFKSDEDVWKRLPNDKDFEFCIRE
jgi:hypothetical protein